MNQKTLLFKLLIVLDYLFNVLTGGGFQTCFSTRCYINSQRHSNKKRWIRIRNIVDKIMCEENHCLKSYAWELHSKLQWIRDNQL